MRVPDSGQAYIWVLGCAEVLVLLGGRRPVAVLLVSPASLVVLVGLYSPI